MDPRDLNEALEYEPYYTRSIKEILGKFHGMKKFTITDFNKGFWMVELHPESCKLTMMALDMDGFNGHTFQWVLLWRRTYFSGNLMQSFSMCLELPEFPTT